ncbi:hypothetical protein ABEB36_001882 [Hypothenemus hampei]|uniref:Egg protein n=1 Tax=Hypothenemus hampei TaxID=57062 RepID=A0ABD1FG11_HYPHA
MSRQIYLIFFLLIILNLDLGLEIQSQESELWSRAKRDLVRRTHEYIKRNPISGQLRAFIEGLATRSKRQNLNDMYAIKDGDVVPLNSLQGKFEGADSISNAGFTVVPLIVPIPLENTITMKTTEKGQPDVEDESTSQRAILGREYQMKKYRERVFMNTDNFIVNTDDFIGNSDVIQEEYVTSTPTTTVAAATTITTTTTTTGTTDDFDKVLEDVQKLLKKNHGSHKEGALCNVSGYWDSESGGECRICEGTEMITGDWLVGRTSTDCRDQKAAHSFISDIFRRNNVEPLRKEHLEKVSINYTDTQQDTTENTY